MPTKNKPETSVSLIEFHHLQFPDQAEFLKEIDWVRLLRDRDGVFGIGFHGKHLLQFIGLDEHSGLARKVSAAESAVMFKHLATRELKFQPDIESNPTAWRRWLRMLVRGVRGQEKKCQVSGVRRGSARDALHIRRVPVT